MLLGELDNDPNDEELRRTEEANAQGAHRLARGRYYYETALSAAQSLQVPLAWSLETVPDVAHQNGPMARAAEVFLFGE